ncbi:MAG: hypothetical protein KA821_18455 [Chitinophagaceae bacterium]|nr:hypothetical protein [Chitinophagaceae bacterium]
MRIEYLTDDGSLVGCERTDHITKLSLKRSKHMVNVSLEFDGKVNQEDAKAINGSFSFPSQKNAYLHCYVKKQNILSKAHRSKYFLTASDSFLGQEQFWIIGADNFCNHLHLELLLPISRSLADVVLMYHKVPQEMRGKYGSVLEYQPKWELVRDPKFIVIKTRDKRIITLQITALKPSEMYKLVWMFTN